MKSNVKVYNRNRAKQSVINAFVKEKFKFKYQKCVLMGNLQPLRRYDSLKARIYVNEEEHDDGTYSLDIRLNTWYNYAGGEVPVHYEEYYEHGDAMHICYNKVKEIFMQQLKEHYFEDKERIVATTLKAVELL